MMSPIMIEIVLHYYTSPTDWRDGEWNEGIRGIIHTIADSLQLIELDPRSHPLGLGYRPGTYKITKRGEVYVEALKALPLPIQVWTIPNASEISHD